MQLSGFNGRDLSALLCGRSRLCAEDVLQSVEIREEEWRDSETRSHLPGVIRSLSEPELAALVRFATGRYGGAHARPTAH